MKLVQLNLKNYRSIKEASLDIDDLQILFGRNNVGKSNILHAIEDYRNYGADISDFRDLYDRVKRNREDRPLHFEIKFSLKDIEAHKLLDKLSAGGHITESTKGELLSNGFGSEISHEFVFANDGVRTAKFKASYKGEMCLITELTERDDRGGSVMKADFNYLPEENMTTDTSGDVYSTHSVLYGPIRSFITKKLDTWKWISPFRHPDIRGPIKEVYSLDRDSSNLPVVLHTLANNRPDTFTSIERSFVEIMEGVTGLNTPIRGQGNTETTVEVEEGNITFDLRDISAGSQQILALLTELKTAGIQTDVLLLEEPETHLHPGAQRTIYKTIKEVVEDTNTQIILTTHSKVFLDAGDSSQLIKTSREDGNTVFNEVDENVENEAMSALGYEKSSILQSRAVIFVEGLSDKRVISQFTDSVGFSLQDNGINIIDLEGEGNMKSHGQSLVKLVSAFDIPFLFILDSHNHDPQTERDALLQAVNAPNGDWEVTPDDVLVWDEYGIESYLLDPEAIAEHLGAEVVRVEKLLEQHRTNGDQASVLNEVFQKVRGQGFVKETDGPLIAAKIDPSNFDPEVDEAIQQIRFLLD